MKVTFFIAYLLAAVAHAGTEATYCDSENLQGSCTDIDTQDDRLCGATKHATKSIKVNPGYQCNLMINGCSTSDLKVFQAGTYNTIDTLWQESKVIECLQL